jgi:DNA-binding transcriptional ArsR family regulator
VSRRRTIELTDPRALRALAHPIRLALLGALRREGPLTATQAGELVGESPASCSFHLRQLAKYGLVEEAGGGRGRERPWRATAQFTSWSGVASTPEMAAALELFTSVIAERMFEQVMKWIARRSDEPREWQEAELFGDTILYVTPDELARLDRDVQALVEPYLERIDSAAARPPGARRVVFMTFGFPHPEDAS